ncbi:hypothetical protein NEOLEDRAFT_1181363 [Neolentinus lepideus HHB14362 ss-1]|uniref:Uncharacterized protein n=1 Tax=Neolentinus lepideus HHB14362 ss-1 TaxID=1314782 RepID=A0A165Q2B1_9AGAM|nr:hypothetical protein NEOLEDRAFT_1181363 [Neolentinus lepideus HHB14362 ss-1]
MVTGDGDARGLRSTLDPDKSPVHWLGHYCTCPFGHVEDDFVRNTAEVLLGVVPQSPGIFDRYAPSTLAMGALMLARFLCGAYMMPFNENEQGLEVMIVLDRQFRNNPELVLDIPNPSTFLPLDLDVLEFYRYARDYLPAVPSSMKEYHKPRNLNSPDLKINLLSYSTVLPDADPTEKLRALLNSMQISPGIEALLDKMRISPGLEDLLDSMQLK